eukprot:m.343014 g.343014  ORF g.343014 m.343014 type:complete len:384 (-) comp22219_c0_seq1:153-1304(-)
MEAINLERLTLVSCTLSEEQEGATILVTVALTDDMGRRVEPSAAVHLTAAWGDQAPNEISNVIGNKAGDGVFDALACFEEECDDEGQDSSGCSETQIELQIHEVKDDSLELTISAQPPRDPYPPLPCGESVGGRWALGNAHVILPLTVMISIGENGKMTHSSVRKLDYGNKAGQLLVHESVAASGYGTKDTYGTVWDCGIILGAFLGTDYAIDLIKQAKDVTGSSVAVDLGSGTGVVGLSLRNATKDVGLSVVLTDIEEGLLLAQRNVIANTETDEESIKVKELFWGSGNEDCIGRLPVSVVVAADVIYDEDAVIGLAKTLNALIGAQTLCFLGFRRRTSAQVIQSFFHEIEGYGLSTKNVDASHLHEIYRAEDAHIIRLSRK